MPLIDYRNLPDHSAGFSRIFKDYLYEFPRVKDFFARDFRELDELPQFIDNFAKPKDHREQLSEILEIQNSRFGCGLKTIENIRKLHDEKTFCVVTGQQVGLLGGPLYTLYKLISAIKLARHLSESFPSYTFLPIFWLEGEDHDFDEVNHLRLLSHENKLSKIEYLIDGKPLERNIGAVGEIVIDSAFTSFLTSVETALPNTEFRTGIMEIIGECYSTGTTLNQGFVRWMNRLMQNALNTEDPGVIYISSNDRNLKRMLAPIFRIELEEFPATSQILIQQSAELEQVYHAQIKPRALNIFMFHKGGRYLIEPRESDFSLKGTRRFISRDELLSIIAETPELLSPNVVLRTICQDTLLPTVAYVGGPSEIAYFAQLKPVYEHFGVPMPVIFPRASATVLEGRLEGVLEKFGIELTQVFGRRQQIDAQVMSTLSEIDLQTVFDSSSQRIVDVLNEMKFGLNYVDSTLLGALETTRGKIESHLQALREKAVSAQQRKHETALRQVDKAVGNIFPGGNYQERELSMLHFLNKHGLNFPRLIYDQLQIDVIGHQVIEV